MLPATSNFVNGLAANVGCYAIAFFGWYVVGSTRLHSGEPTPPRFILGQLLAICGPMFAVAWTVYRARHLKFHDAYWPVVLPIVGHMLILAVSCLAIFAWPRFDMLD